MSLKTLFRGKVTRVTAEGVYVEVPHIGTGYDMLMQAPTDTQLLTGDAVLVGQIENVADDFVILQRLGKPFPTPEQKLYIPKAQEVLSGGGVRTVVAGSGGRIKWSQRIIGISAGRTPTLLTGSEGFFEAICPTSGTIPVYGKTAVTSVTADANGIPLFGWDALWYEPPLVGGTPGFRITHWNTTLTIPPHWVFIAQRNGDSNDVKWFDGLTDSGWIAPTLVNGWANYGGTWEPAGYRRLSGNTHLRGLLNNGITTSGTVLFTLPPGFRPSTNAHTPAHGTGQYGAVNVMADGNVIVNTGVTSYISVRIAPFPVDQ